jgi:hypothetical protein
VRVETVHFAQELIQGLFSFIVAAAEPCAAGTAHRIDLVDKNDARMGGLGLLEHVSHAGSPDPYKHLDKFRGAYTVKRDPGLTCRCAGKKGLPCPRRTDQ